MKTRRLTSLASASVLAVSTLFNIALMPVVHAAVQTCDWTGTAGDNKFSTAGNWNNCGGGVPLAGDIIKFSTKNASTVNLTNDLGVSLGGVQLAATTDASNSSGYLVDTVSLDAGAGVSVVPGTLCSDRVVPVGFSTINAAGNVSLVSYNFYSASPVLTTTGNLILDTGYATFGNGSSVGGGVTVTAPSSITSATGCAGGGGGGANPGASITGFTINSLTVQKGGSVALGNTAYPLTLGGGSATIAPTVSFLSNYDVNYNYVATTYTVSGAITLVDDAVFSPGSKATVNVTGSISGTGKAITKDPYAAGVLNINPSSNTSATQTGTLVNPTKTTTIASGDSSAASLTVVDNETTTLDGTRGNVSVLSGGILMGSGTATDGIFVADGGIIAPGHSPGCMNSGNLTLFGTYQFEVGGTTACTGYDQIKVTGTVDVTGGLIDVSIYGDFVPAVGQSYTIIDNDAADAVTGTLSFAGFSPVPLAEGATFTDRNGAVTYSITYKGGDGNDIVLTVTAVDASKLPKAPNTGFKLLTANPAITLLATMTAAGAILLAHKRMQKPAGKRR